MIVLRATGIHRSYGPRTVLSGASLAIGERDRIGLVGTNGAGKSTFLRILAGEPADAGRVVRAPGVRVALLKQELTDLAATSWETALAGAGEILAWRARWEALTRELGLAPERQDVLRDVGEVQAALERAGGFSLEAQARRVLRGVGLPEELWSQPVGRLSGGERTRLNLAGTLLAAPDVLLLDEPTNHLDITAIEWLEGFLAEFRGAAVIVSHDRRLLDRTVDRIAALEDGRIVLFPGNYSAYRATRARQLAAEAAAYARHRQDVERLQAFVRRQVQRAAQIQAGPKRDRDFYGRIAKKVARRAQSARKRLERAERQAPGKPRLSESVHLSVDAAESTGPALAHLRDVHVHLGSRVLFAGFSLTLGRGARVGLVGPNGSGKTTLLQLLAGRRGPTAGEVWVTPGVRAGYLPQIPFEGDRERRVLDVALDAGLDPTEARAVLGALLFRGDRVFQSVEELSGGEKTRLALLAFIATHCNLLLLDEPTNHLDLPSRERLEDVLEAYGGAIVVASHDRFLLDRLCTTIWAIEGRAVRVFAGTYSDAQARAAT